MKICSKCNSELVDDLEVTAQGVYQVSISYKKRISSNHRGNIKAALCPNCGDVSFYLILLVSKSTELAASQFSEQGFSAMVPALTFLQTGLSEELFFR